jgi:uncharacterized phage-associated protein
MTVSARDVAAAIRERLPRVPTKKLHKLLYYCQGHHLAHFGKPLFSDTISAWKSTTARRPRMRSSAAPSWVRRN